VGEPPLGSSPDVEYADRVRAWAGLLRAGSAQTWSDFLDGPEAVAAPVDELVLPGAAQLELVRRLAAQVGGDPLPDFHRLADLVLTTAGPGRGLVDVPLPWRGDSTGTSARIGTPPVEPDQLPAEEILRIAAGVLARLLATASRVPDRRRPRTWRRWRRGFTLLGAPTTVDLVRAALRARGLREGGTRTTYLVLGGPLEDLMAQRWSSRVRAGAGLRWQSLWRTAATNDRVPPGIALPTIAAHLADEFDPARVHVVLADDASATLALVGEVLGVSTDPIAGRSDVLATDLLRRVNPALTLAVGEDVRRQIVGHVWPEISSGEDPGPLGAPDAQLDWAIAAGERMATRLSGGRYAVHGEPALVVPSRRPGVRRTPDADDVLAHALLVVARAWRRHAGSDHGAGSDRLGNG